MEGKKMNFKNFVGSVTLLTEAKTGSEIYCHINKSMFHATRGNMDNNDVEVFATSLRPLYEAYVSNRKTVGDIVKFLVESVEQAQPGEDPLLAGIKAAMRF